MKPVFFVGIVFVFQISLCNVAGNQNKSELKEEKLNADFVNNFTHVNEDYHDLLLSWKT